MKRVNEIAFFITFFTVLASIVYKVFAVPITHDEVSTVLNYFNHSYWEIIMYPDFVPNNHILNTLSGKLFSQIFGLDVWAVRIQSIIAYFIYSFAVYRIVRSFFSMESVLAIAGFALFFSNPYLLDFFGLCRGYGLAAAFVTLSSSFVISGFNQNKDADIWKAVVFAILASYSNFTVLVFWAAITILTGIYFIIKYRDSVRILLSKQMVLAAVSVLYLLLIYVPIKKMTSSGQFRFWSSHGFFDETIVTSINNWRYGDGLLDGVNSVYMGYFVVFVFIIGLLFSLFVAVKYKLGSRVFQDSVFISFAILVLTIVVSQIQIMLLHTPNIEGRIALFMYPLFVLLFASLISKIKDVKYRYLKYFVATVIPIFAFWHLANTYNPKSVREWWYDENTLEVIDYIKKTNPKSEVSLKTYWIFYNSFDYYDRLGKMEGIKLHKNSKLNVDDDVDYYYIEDGQLKQIKSKFKKVKRFGSSRWLMKRKN